jgi:NAD(P)-dependent dehydrogenase (short-subunit alcohol dehydrogenase family)
VRQKKNLSSSSFFLSSVPFEVCLGATLQRYGKFFFFFFFFLSFLFMAGQVLLSPHSQLLPLPLHPSGPYLLSLALQDRMPPGRAAIIHISSTRALQSEPGCEAYAASKAGLLGLAHAQAASLAGRVRVNAVLPGWIDTGIGPALREEDHAWHSAGRVGTPADVAELCLFLADGDKAGFITGQQFVMDGGVSKRMVYPE